MVAMISLPSSTVVKEASPALLASPVEVLASDWEMEALPLELAEPGALWSPLLPQAARDRDMAKAMVKASSFFMFKNLLFNGAPD